MSIVCDSRGCFVPPDLQKIADRRREIATSSKRLSATFNQAFTSKGCKGLNLLKERAQELVQQALAVEKDLREYKESEQKESEPCVFCRLAMTSAMIDDQKQRAYIQNIVTIVQRTLQTRLTRNRPKPLTSESLRRDNCVSLRGEREARRQSLSGALCHLE